MATTTTAMTILLLFILFFIFNPITVLTYSYGPPQTVCLMPYPHHLLNVKQTDTPPFTITLSNSTYTAGSTITVTITSTKPFEGFLIKVRRQKGEIQRALGSWSGCSESRMTYFSMFPDVSTDKNCISHNTKDPKTSLTCTWTAPPTNKGDLTVSATIVYQFDVFYADINQDIKSAMTTPVAPSRISVAAPLTQIPTMYDCGSTKSCVLYPYHCWLSNTCYYMISYRPTSNGTVKMELLMPASYQYGVVGISRDEKMGQDQMIMCMLMADGTPMIQTQNGATFVALPSLDVQVQNKYMNTMADWRGDNYLFCSFELPLNFSISYQDNYIAGGPMNLSQNFNLNEPNYLFFGFGNIYSGSFSYQAHVVTPMISYYNLVLNSNQWDIQYFYGLRRHVRIHSTLTSIAWLLFAPIGHLAAAHLRSNLKHRFLKSRLWFLFYVICLIVTTCCTIAGFIFILGINMQWKSNATAHGVLACVTLGFVFINILVSLFKPSSGTKKRYYYNIFHSLVGYITRSCSIVTIWLAITLPVMNVRFQTWAYAVIGIWTCFEFLFFLFAFIKRAVAYKRYKRYFHEKPHTENECRLKRLPERRIRHISNWVFAFYVIFIIGLFSSFIVDIWLN